jgi:DEAD/DEAH box helicase domain-containing protein
MGNEGYQEFENPENLNRKGESFYLTGNLNEADKCFQKVLEMDENNISAMKYQGIIRVKQEKPEKALEFFEKVLLIQDDDPETLYYQAVCFNNVQKYVESKNISMKLLKTRPDWDDAWSVLAIALHALGDKEKAIEAYNKALELDPLNQDAARNLKDLLG